MQVDPTCYGCQQFHDQSSQSRFKVALIFTGWVFHDPKMPSRVPCVWHPSQASYSPQPESKVNFWQVSKIESHHAARLQVHEPMSHHILQKIYEQIGHKMLWVICCCHATDQIITIS